MTTVAEGATARHVIPDEIRAIFGKPPLLCNEDAAAYERLHSRIASTIDPQDIIDWIWVRDITDLQWEIMRLRRFQALIINNARRPALQYLCRIALDDGELPPESVYKVAKKVTDGAMAGGATGKELASDQLKAYGIDEDAVDAAAFNQQVETLETLARMTAAAELRRDKVLREVEIRREVVGRRLRQIVVHSEPAIRLAGPPDEASIQVPERQPQSPAKES